MKRGFSFFVAAVLLLVALLPCNAVLADSGATVWSSVSLTMNGMTMPTDSDWSMKLTLNADNTGIIEYSFSEPKTGEWNDAGTMILFFPENGMEVFTKTSDGKLTYELGDITVTFESDKPQDTSAVAGKYASKITGTWVAQTVTYNGFTVPVSTIGLTMTVVIKESGEGSITVNGGKPDTGKWTASGDSFYITVGDGRVFFEVASDGNITYTEDGYTVTLERQ